MSYTTFYVIDKYVFIYNINITTCLLYQNFIVGIITKKCFKRLFGGRMMKKI